MSVGHHRHPVALILSTSLLVASAVGAQGGVAGAAADADVKAKAPNVVKKLDWTWYGDARESSEPGAAIQGSGDMVAVGVAFERGNGKIRKRLAKQAGKKDRAAGTDTRTGKNDTVAHVVVNLAGAVPASLSGDVVLVVGADGAGAVPYSSTTPDSLTQGAAYVHVIGRYGSQQGQMLTGDDTTAGDPPGSQIDFGVAGTGAGGYDKKTKSIYTSFKLPKDAKYLTVTVYDTSSGSLVIDRLAGPIGTDRIPIKPTSNALECAKIELFARQSVAGQPDGVFDVRATLVQTGDGAADEVDASLAFDVPGGPNGAPTEASAETLPGSGLSVWYGVVDTGSPQGGTIAVGAGSSPTLFDAFGNVTLHAGPDELATVYGAPDCGNVLRYEGCTNGGGLAFFTGLLEQAGRPVPDGLGEAVFPAPNGAPYCVALDNASGQALAAFGIEPTPFTLDRHMRDMDANACSQAPAAIGLGGVLATCPDGTRTLRWLETGVDPAAEAGDEWGFRPDLTILAAGAEALGWDATTVPPASVLDAGRAQAQQVLAEAGFEPGERGFLAPPADDSTSDDDATP